MNLHIDNDTCHEIIFTQGGVSHSLDKLYYNEHLVWEKQHDYSKDYFTITSLTNNNIIKLRSYSGNSTYQPTWKIVEYSTDGTNWTSLAPLSGTTEVNVITLNINEKVMFRSNTSNWAIKKQNGSTNYYYNQFFKPSNNYEISGNIMSLLWGSNFLSHQNQFPVYSNYFQSDITVSDYGIFNDLFRGNTTNDSHLISATNLILPATNMIKYCYEGMFAYCTSLTTAPKLPATTLAEYCYHDLFFNCSSLVDVPILPATTLVGDMCYGYMFYGCTSLKSIICLATEIPSTMCTWHWVENISSSGTFYKNPAMSSWTTGTSGIPSGWTVVNW